MKQEVGLGLRLQNARKKAGLTQQELCQKSGLSYSTLAKIERGAIKSPSIFTIQQISNVLGVGIDQIIGPPANLPPQKKKSKTGISFVYFDINGCLVGFFHRAFAKISVDLGIALDKVETACWSLNEAVCRGDITLDDYNSKLAEIFGVKDFDWSKYYLESVDPIPEARELVAWAGEHYKIGLLSNIMPGLIEEMKKRDLIPDFKYDVIIASCEVGAIKPESKIFEIAQQKAGVPTEEILLVDDSRANLTSASAQGWRVSWFDDYRPEESVERVRQALEF